LRYEKKNVFDYQSSKRHKIISALLYIGLVSLAIFVNDALLCCVVVGAISILPLSFFYPAFLYFKALKEKTCSFYSLTAIFMVFVTLIMSSLSMIGLLLINATEIK